jgi:hypothetical protein
MPDLNFNATQEIILVIGSSGGDGGCKVLTPHGVVHVPGNNPDGRRAYETVMKDFAALQEVALKQKAGGSISPTTFGGEQRSQ